MPTVLAVTPRINTTPAQVYRTVSFLFEIIIDMKSVGIVYNYGTHG